MARSLPEWIGRSDDSPIPDRVKLRIFLKYDGCCQCGCARPIKTGEAWQADHRVALINGGQNRESNLVPLLVEHHKAKTECDVSEKAQIYKKRLKHYGLKKPKGRPLMGTKRSGWKRKLDGTVVRR